MATLQIILLVTAVFLAIYLQFLIRRRTEKERPLPNLDWTGRGPDLSTVAETVGRVRRNYFAPAHSRSQDTVRRALLVASARSGLMRLAYFADREDAGVQAAEPQAKNS